MTTQYTKEQFFSLYACTGYRRPFIELFIAGRFECISQSRFSRLVSCSFVAMGREWQLSNNTISEVK